MSQSLQIIDTKLTPPMVKDHYIRRASLMRRLHRMNDYPLTIIHSGAGFGKSTALSLYMNDYHPNFCWYTITANDDDLSPFITYIVHAIKKRYPDFGDSILDYLETMNRYIRDQEILMLTSLFIKEFQTITDDINIVLDDFHLVDHSFTINQWLENLIENLPPHIHLVISSRMQPKWGLLSKWRVTGKLLIIDEKELLLTLEDIDLLFTDYHRIVLDENELEQILEISEGWVIAVSMIAEQLKSGTELQDLLQLQHSSMDDLFQYLAFEVFSKQPPMIQSFIEQVSAFEIITPTLCDQILGIQGSQAILEQLVLNNAFIHKLHNSDQYRFHALFKATVERKMKAENFLSYQQLHENIAQYFLKHGFYEEALYHYEKTQNNEAIAHLLELLAPDMLKGGKLESLLDKLKGLPNSVKDQFRRLWYYEGEVLRYLSYYEKARQCYEHLIHLSKDFDDPLFIGRAYEGLSQIYLDTIQPQLAEKYLPLAIEIMEEHLGVNHPHTQKLYALMAENLINLGRAKLAEKWIRKGNLKEQFLMMNNLDARMLLRTGKLQEAKETLEKRLMDQGHSLPQTHRETEILLSYVEACLGNGENAKQLAQKGIEQGIKYKNSFVEACGWMRLAHASQLLDTYQNRVIEECYMTSLDIMEEIDVSRGKAEPYMGLSILYSRLGNHERSQTYGQLALYETEKVHDFWLSSYIRLCMGITSFNSNKLQDAETILKKTIDDFNQCVDPYGVTLSNLWLSFIYYENGEWENFKETVTRFLQEVEIGGYEFLFKKKSIFGPKDLQNFLPILLKAKSLGIQTSFIHSLLKDLGYEDIDSHPGYTLKVKTFGGFQVYLGDNLVSEKEWQRAKAKELFQFLIIHKEQWWSREEIYEQLWPNVPTKNAEQEFKVILNSLNKALEPHRKTRTAPFFIIRQNQMYKINPQAAMDLDFYQFEQWIRQGLSEKNPEKAKTILLKGMDLYQGEFLAGYQNHLFITTKRELYRSLFLRGAERIAQVYVQLEQFDEAIYWCERILEIDQTWEESYRLLMFCHYKKNNRPYALKYFHMCCEILEKELGVEPMETTKQMYEMILESGR